MQVWLKVAKSLAVVAWLAGGVASAARAEPNVVVTIKPVHALVAGVMAGVGTPELMIKGNASPHSYAMRPSDARALARADVVFWVGGALEVFLRKPVAGLREGVRVVELMDAAGMIMRKVRDPNGFDEARPHEDQGAAGGSSTEPASGAGGDGHGAHDDHDSHVHGGLDAHIWLDTENARVIVRTAVRVLSERDPANRTTYEANGSRMIERIDGLERDLAATLRPVRGRPFMVFHDAFQHFEARFGLRLAGVVSLGGGRTPGARHLRELKQRIASLKVECLFSEPQFEPRLVQILAQETGVRTGVLDPLGVAIEAGADHYFKLLRANAQALKACLGGDG